jgi:hypothetical protein
MSKTFYKNFEGKKIPDFCGRVFLGRFLAKVSPKRHEIFRGNVMSKKNQKKMRNTIFYQF